MESLYKVIQLSESDFTTLLSNINVTKGGKTLTYNSNILYLRDRSPVPEFAKGSIKSYLSSRSKVSDLAFKININSLPNDEKLEEAYNDDKYPYLIFSQPLKYCEHYSDKSALCVYDNYFYYDYDIGRLIGAYYGSFSGNLSGYADYAYNIFVNQNISSNADYPLIWSNQNNEYNRWGQQLYKSYDYLLYNPYTKVLRNDGPLWLRPDRDATLKIYSGKITDSYSDGFICMQTSIDGTDGQSHSYPTSYGARCVIALQPRGGEVYIGKTITAASTSADTNYKLNVGGNAWYDGNLYLNTGDTDKFIQFSYNTNNYAGASWRLISRGSGSGDTNYFDIETGGSNSGANTWYRVIRLTMDNRYVGIGTDSPAEKLHVTGNIGITSASSGNTIIGHDLDALIIGPKTQRSGTSNSYYPGIAFNHMFRYSNASYDNAAQGWIGLRLHSTPGSELSYLVFATKPGTGTSNSGNDRPLERMCIAPDGKIGIGTISPAENLHVVGIIRASNGSYYVNMRQESSTWSSFYTNAAQYYFDHSIYVNGALWRYNTNYGIASDGQIYGKAIYANRDASSTYGGISLYSNDANTYAIFFRGTSTYGTHGGVTSDWATYLTTSDTTNRGWIFRRGSTNVASIDGNGRIYVGAVTSSANPGLYWNPYVESSSDGSDAAGIWQIRSGVAGGTELRISQANDSNDVINICSPYYIYFNSKRAFGIYDGWLRINENIAFNSGIYTGSSLIRTDNQLQVGGGGSAFYANSSGNGWISNQFIIGASRTRFVNFASTLNHIPPYSITGLLSFGYPVYTDPEFASGNNSVSVYNNNGNGTVTITREASSESANSSGYQLKIVTNGSASPGAGGFVQTISSRANAVFVQIFRAKIPTGWQVNTASNNMGNSYSDGWLTEQAGTGKWEWYARIVHCGSTGTMSSGGHVYLSNTSGGANTSVTWYVCHCSLIDITKQNYNGLRTRYADNATYTSNVYVTQNTDSNAKYPLIWSNQNNTNSAWGQQLYKSYSDIFWNPGLKALGHGIDVVATGSCSHAEGYKTQATGYNTHAEGCQTIASGEYSHAEGYGSKSTGSNSHAEGNNSESSGAYSHAEGNYTVASGGHSHAEGGGTDISGRTIASGPNTHAEGFHTTASGVRAHSEGSDTVAAGNRSHAEGSQTKAHGYASHAEGNYTVAGISGNNTENSEGHCAHAEGEYTTASGLNSHAEGYHSIANGRYAHAQNYYTTASGYYSHAQGNNTTASGSYSFAGGYYTIASHENETALGKYNVSNSNTVFSIGWGSSSSRFNIFEVKSNGWTYFNGSTYYINGSYYNGTAANANTLGGYSFQNLEDRYVNISGDWMNTDAQIYFRGANSSTSVYGSIGYRDSFNGKMHLGSDTYNTKALYVCSNGYNAANDCGGIAIDNDGVTAFGAGDTGSVFRVLNEDNVSDGAQFAVTKASGAAIKYNLSVGQNTVNTSYKLYVSGSGYITGETWLNSSIYIISDPGISLLQSSYGLRSDYTSVGHPTEEYLKAWTKYAYNKAAGRTVLGIISPNSRGFIFADIYNSGLVTQSLIDSGGSYTSATLGLPVHITGRYYPHGGTGIIFGTSYGVWYYRTNIDSSNLLGYYWANIGISATSSTTTTPQFGYVGINVANTSGDYRLRVNGYSHLSYIYYTPGNDVTDSNVSDSAVMVITNGSDAYLRKGTQAAIRKYVRVPWGFSSWTSGATWGNTTGTSIASWNDSTGGSIDFRRDNPSSGKISIKVDGRVYVNEGTNPCLSAVMSSYWAIRNPDGGDTWIQTTSNGFLPYTSGGEWAGHSSLGTSSWYFGNVYSQYINGIHIRNILINNSTAWSTSFDQETFGVQDNSSPKISILHGQATVPIEFGYSWSSAIAFKMSDTKGMMVINYGSPAIRFSGGSSTQNLAWWMAITGASGTSYNLTELRDYVIVNQHIGNNVDYPLVWSNQNNTSTVRTNQLHKSYDYLLYNPSTKVLRNDGPLWLRPDRDATLKIYSGKITDGYSDGFICMQTSIDGTDGQSHSYPTSYGNRCVIALQPRGGEVYVGKTITAASTYADTTYKLNVGGSALYDGNIYINTGDNDRFIQFSYNSNNYAGAAWRLISRGSGSGDTNYFDIETGGSNAGANTWYRVIRLTMDNRYVGIGTDSPTQKIDIAGNIRVCNPSDNQIIARFLNYSTSPYGLMIKSYTNGNLHLQSQRESNNSETFGLLLNPNGGNVGIGTTSPSYKLHVSGNTYITGYAGIGNAPNSSHGRLVFIENNIAIGFRPNNNAYKTSIQYMTTGNEALVFSTQQSVTSFIFKCGHAASNGSDWQSGVIGTPSVQIKQQSLYVNGYIADGSSPSYNLYVGGTAYISGQHYAAGYHHNSVNSNSYAISAGGGYKPYSNGSDPYIVTAVSQAVRIYVMPESSYPASPDANTLYVLT